MHQPESEADYAAKAGNADFKKLQGCAIKCRNFGCRSCNCALPNKDIVGIEI